MEKTYARFVTLSNPGNFIKKITLGGITLYQVEFKEEITNNIYEQSEQYFLSSHDSYYYENDIRGDIKKGELLGGFEIRKLISSFSGVYSTNEPQVDILVSGQEFVGVVVLMREQNASTWTNNTREWFVIHYTDGSIIGVNKAEISIYTEDNSTDEVKSYWLIKK